MNGLPELDTHKHNFLDDARKQDGEIGGILNDVAIFVAHQDYKRAAQASAYLLIAIAKKQGLKPFTLLRQARK